jgi:hypothetical protein
MSSLEQCMPPKYKVTQKSLPKKNAIPKKQALVAN